MIKKPLVSSQETGALVGAGVGARVGAGVGPTGEALGVGDGLILEVGCIDGARDGSFDGT